eukprot:Seg1766.1 transcript_id=Seg1766.1/GoldUCD/mRNA.D3Y31 product="Translation initiation factor eIF-2B subunit epsilon" protein_id=Seg1766.1/GoldUCD/D3Y31
MSQKKKGKDSEASKDKWNKEEDPLQAVVVADSFNSKFLPITVERPRTLLPLVNHFLLDYTIEYLLEEGVQEIILFCCANAAQIKEYASKAKWSQSKECTIQVVISSSQDCMSFGDALREIDREGLIRSDFLIVPGDLISNVKLKEHIQEHKIRRKKEKNSVMTMLYRVAKPRHFSRCLEEDTFIALEPESKRIIHCQKSCNNRKFTFPMGLLSERDSMQMRYDLADCNIAICSPTVPPLFTDNFDYQSKEDFVRGILINEEIMGNQVHCHVVEEEYAARVSNLHMYNAISLDIINRWAYPLVPDNGSYRYSRHNVYLDKGVRLERDCLLEQDVVIGKNSSIGTGTCISKTVIGKNCKIGENVKITNSYIWDDVIIEDECSIDFSIICNGCHIKRNVKMTDAVASFKVILGPDLNIVSGSKFSLVKPESVEMGMEDLSIDSSSKACPKYDKNVVGCEGAGYLWPESDVDEDDEEAPTSTLRGEFYESDDESSDDESIPSPTGSPPPEAGALFFAEVLDNIRCGISENSSTDNIILEVNASKYKYNVSIREINQAVIKSILQSVLEDSSRSKQAMVQQLDKIVSNFLALILNYIKGGESQIDGITAAEEYFAENPTLAGIFPTFLHKLYDKDVLHEDVILKWYKSPVFAEDPEMAVQYKRLRQHELMKRFITWLEEAEEESEEESD